MSGTDPQIREILIAINELRQWRKETDERIAEFWRHTWVGVQAKMETSTAELKAAIAQLRASISEHTEIDKLTAAKTLRNETRIESLEKEVQALKVKIAVLAAIGGGLGAAGGEFFRGLFGG